MTNLIKNEFRKILKSKLIVGFLFSSALLIWLNIITYDPKIGDWKIDSLYAFPKSLIEIYMQVLMFFVPILVGSLVTKDLVNGTLKLSLIREPSRIKNLIAKQLSFVVFIFIGTLAFILICYFSIFIYVKGIAGLPLVQVDKLTDITQTFLLYGGIFFPTIAYGLFCILVGIIIENAIVANVASIIGVVFFFHTEIGSKFTAIASMTCGEIKVISFVAGLISLILIVVSNIYIEKKDILY